MSDRVGSISGGRTGSDEIMALIEKLEASSRRNGEKYKQYRAELDSRYLHTTPAAPQVSPFNYLPTADSFAVESVGIAENLLRNSLDEKTFGRMHGVNRSLKLLSVAATTQDLIDSVKTLKEDRARGDLNNRGFLAKTTGIVAGIGIGAGLGALAIITLPASVPVIVVATVASTAIGGYIGAKKITPMAEAAYEKLEHAAEVVASRLRENMSEPLIAGAESLRRGARTAWDNIRNIF